GARAPSLAAHSRTARDSRAWWVARNRLQGTWYLRQRATARGRGRRGRPGNRSGRVGRDCRRGLDLRDRAVLSLAARADEPRQGTAALLGLVLDRRGLRAHRDLP